MNPNEMKNKDTRNGDQPKKVDVRDGMSVGSRRDVLGPSGERERRGVKVVRSLETTLPFL